MKNLYKIFEWVDKNWFWISTIYLLVVMIIVALLLNEILTP